MKKPISITAISSLSALGGDPKDAWQAYQNKGHCLVQRTYNGNREWVGALAPKAREQAEELRVSDPKYRHLDNSVLYAMVAARNAIRSAGWSASDNFGVNIGSSRGATGLLERYHGQYLKTGRAATLASPTTTLGNISSWVAHDLGTNGPEISHSITCSTALHALLNGVAWIQAGMAGKFLVGGSEAPLTPFTLAQMKALKIYTQHKDKTGYPCEALHLKKTKNTMVLGEGAAMICLEKGNAKKVLANILGVGYGTETLSHNVSLSTNATCFQRSMAMALGSYSPKEVDVMVMHAPGTVKGDQAEMNAIGQVFGTQPPFLTTNKWKLGHTFGASGLLSLELAVLMLQHQKAIKVPFITYTKEPQQINRVMVNAVGFGGNAVSILLSRADRAQ